MALITAIGAPLPAGSMAMITAIGAPLPAGSMAMITAPRPLGRDNCYPNYACLTYGYSGRMLDK